MVCLWLNSLNSYLILYFNSSGMHILCYLFQYVDSLFFPILIYFIFSYISQFPQTCKHCANISTHLNFCRYRTVLWGFRKVYPLLANKIMFTSFALWLLKVSKHYWWSHPVYGRPRGEPGVCADIIWLHWQRCGRSSIQEGGDPHHLGEAWGTVVECQKQRWTCGDDPCALCGEIGKALTPPWPAHPWISQLEQLRDPWAFSCARSRLRPASDTFSTAPWHAWSSHHSSTLRAEWPRYGEGHPETSALCLW